MLWPTRLWAPAAGAKVPLAARPPQLPWLGLLDARSTGTGLHRLKTACCPYVSCQPQAFPGEAPVTTPPSLTATGLTFQHEHGSQALAWHPSENCLLLTLQGARLERHAGSASPNLLCDPLCNEGAGSLVPEPSPQVVQNTTAQKLPFCRNPREREDSNQGRVRRKPEEQCEWECEWVRVDRQILQFCLQPRSLGAAGDGKDKIPSLQ